MSSAPQVELRAPRPLETHIYLREAVALRPDVPSLGKRESEPETENGNHKRVRAPGNAVQGKSCLLPVPASGARSGDPFQKPDPRRRSASIYRF